MVVALVAAVAWANTLDRTKDDHENDEDQRGAILVAAVVAPGAALVPAVVVVVADFAAVAALRGVAHRHAPSATPNTLATVAALSVDALVPVRFELLAGRAQRQKQQEQRSLCMYLDLRGVEAVAVEFRSVRAALGARNSVERQTHLQLRVRHFRDTLRRQN